MLNWNTFDDIYNLQLKALGEDEANKKFFFDDNL